jgi:cell division control protein 7
MQTFFNKFTLNEVRYYLYELLMGLKELKELGIYHRDIKPSNFLYDETARKGVIVDFGLAEIDEGFVKKLREKVKELQESCHELYE